MIVAAAILKNGVIYTGKRHHECIHKIVEATGIRPAGGIQGFVDEHGKFYDRKEAMEHALQCGQIKERISLLMSEDLW